MDIKPLKSFVCVAKHKSFSEAARELNTVQPAISRHISSLEEELGVLLFRRNSRDVSITQAGDQLLKDATLILQLNDQAKVQAKRAHKGQIGHLNIGYLGSACLSFLAQIIRCYKLSFPNVHVTLFEMTATDNIEALQSDAIDIAFSRPLPDTLRNDYSTYNVYTDKLVLIVNKHHKLAGRQHVELSELKDEEFIIFNRNEALGLFDETITLCHQAGFSPNIVSQPRHMQTLVTEVAAGLGTAIAPYCTRKLYNDGCDFIRLEKVNTEIPMEIQYKTTRLNTTIEEFLKIVMDARNDIRDSMAI
ncbi:LysR family transcriptional regulator [Marinomonas sp.]